MALTSLSVISAVVASNVNHRGSKETRLPTCFRTFVIFLSRLVCMRLVYIKRDNPQEVRAVKMQVAMRDGYTGLKSTFSNDSGCNLIDYENGEPAQMRSITTSRRPQVERSWELEEILRKLQVLISKEEEREKIDVILKEWMEAAEVIDRFMFWIFVFWTFFATIFLLLFMPMAKSVET